jgi:hypothetical protein
MPTPPEPSPDPTFDLPKDLLPTMFAPHNHMINRHHHSGELHLPRPGVSLPRVPEPPSGATEAPPCVLRQAVDDVAPPRHLVRPLSTCALSPISRGLYSKVLPVEEPRAFNDVHVVKVGIAAVLSYGTSRTPSVDLTSQSPMTLIQGLDHTPESVDERPESAVDVRRSHSTPEPCHRRLSSPVELVIETPSCTWRGEV